MCVWYSYTEVLCINPIASCTLFYLKNWQFSPATSITAHMKLVHNVFNWTWLGQI